MSPSIKHTLSFPINSSPKINASANPLGFSCTLYVRDIRKNGDIVFSTLKSGAVTGVVKQSQLVGAKDTNGNTAKAINYSVRVTANVLNIRKGPGTSYAITGTIRNKGVYTIVQKSGRWGKLKSGAGWINLDYTKKV